MEEKENAKEVYKGAKKMKTNFSINERQTAFMTPISCLSAWSNPSFFTNV